MIGTIVNTIAIVVGSCTGSILKRGIRPEYQKVLFIAMGLASLALGFNAVSQNMPHSNYPVLFIVSLSIGALAGTIMDLDRRAKQLVARFKNGKPAENSDTNSLAQGLTTGVLLFCIGTLSIIGPINSALLSDHTYLYTNATLDLVSSAVLAATYGIGMAFAAPILSGSKSLASILVETSSASTMSIPSVSILSNVDDDLGRAIASIIAASAITLQMNGRCLAAFFSLLPLYFHGIAEETTTYGRKPFTSLIM